MRELMPWLTDHQTPAKVATHAASVAGITYSAVGTWLGFAQTLVAIFAGLAGGVWACIQIYSWWRRGGR